jgi:hypothetical protein
MLKNARTTELLNVLCFLGEGGRGKLSSLGGNPGMGQMILLMTDNVIITEK